MSKPKIVVYTVDSGGMPKGPRYQNPQWFDAVHKDASKVIIVGNWPDVQEAYRGLGIPVDVVESYPPREDVAAVETGQRIIGNTMIGGAVFITAKDIPDDWESLPWADPEGGQTIRKVAQQFSEAVVINSRHAAKIIRDELARRVGA